MLTEQFNIGQNCPEGKMKAGADILCHKCPFPLYTPDSMMCFPCSAGQVPTEKGDGCRCADGHYNSTRGLAKCYANGLDVPDFLCATLDVRDSMGNDTASADALASVEAQVGDLGIICPQLVVPVCSVCPSDCASCDGGVLNIKAGYSTSTPLASVGLVLDEMSGGE
jgi:hypothetical protein